MTNYDVGDLVKVIGTFTDPDAGDALIDPTAVFLSVKDPSGNLTTFEYDVDDDITRESEGVYSAEIDCDEAGTFYYRWFSTGLGKAAEEKSFKVDAPQAI